VLVNNKKENIKVVAAKDDYSVKISYMSNDGKRRSRTVDIPYDVDFETSKATYKNGILEVKFDR
jgi:HSP20 family molecular chaperone IbpA